MSELHWLSRIAQRVARPSNAVSGVKQFLATLLMRARASALARRMRKQR